jgi:carbon monoxide dehydrogenase subunit G
MVNEVKKLWAIEKQTVAPCPRSPPLAANGGSVHGLRNLIRALLLACQPDSPTAQGRWGLTQTFELQRRMHMDKARISIQGIMPTARERLFEFLTTPGQVRLVLPGLIESTNISELPLKQGSTFDYKYQMYGVILEGQWEVTLIEAPSRYEARTTGAGVSTWKYRLEEASGGTQLSLAVEYEMPKSLLGQVKVELLKTINEKEIAHFFENLRSVFELQA